MDDMRKRAKSGVRAKGSDLEGQVGFSGCQYMSLALGFFSHRGLDLSECCCNFKNNSTPGVAAAKLQQRKKAAADPAGGWPQLLPENTNGNSRSLKVWEIE